MDISENKMEFNRCFFYEIIMQNNILFCFADYHHGLPPWGIALSVLGVLIFLAVVIVVPVSVYCCCYIRRSHPGTTIQMPVAGSQSQMAVAMQMSGGLQGYSAPMYVVYNPGTGQVSLPASQQAPVAQTVPPQAPVAQAAPPQAPVYDNIATIQNQDNSKVQL